MSWPLTLKVSRGALVIAEPGRYTLMPSATEALIDELLQAARAQLGDIGTGWMPEGGGLLNNLPAWENVLLSTQWHAPAALPALEARLRAWMARLGYDDEGARLLLSQAPARLHEDERRLVGWLRQLLSRPRLVLMAGLALPEGALGQRVLALLDEELAGTALLVVDDEAPGWFTPLSLAHAEADSR
ncbi:MAG: hypothetical protein ACOY3X_08575 [Pseudomonadota bacterium]